MPLFSFVWQYNNQPINQLAQDINEFIAGNVNQYVIPVSSVTSFVNSNLVNTPSLIETRGWLTSDGVNTWGMSLNHATKDVLIGDGYCSLQVNNQFPTVGIGGSDWNSASNFAQLTIEVNTNKIQTFLGGPSGQDAGFKLDYNNDLYEFGAYNLGGSDPKLKVDTNANNVSLQIQDGPQTFNLGLNIDGIYANTLTAATSGGASGTFMEINVNGTPYKLELHTI